jgi:SAM-dependent methyltransferase
MNESHLTYLASAEWREQVQRELLPWVLGSYPLGADLLELGPGPGVTTDALRELVGHLVAIELDPLLAADLAQRLAGSNVEVVHGSATDLPFEDDRFSAAACFTMLHHVPSTAEQDQLLSEALRVLRPGGVFLGTDSVDTPLVRSGHVGDIFVPVDPDTFPGRLEAAGFESVELELVGHKVRFAARKPARPKQSMS